jgi:hypothetical protein
MLPGFRFLFAAIVLSTSILIFGLGAAALLRTAHEEFASTPTWQPAPETRFAQAGDATREATGPVLALLRVDEAPTAEPPAAADVEATATAQSATIAAAEPGPIAASPPDSALTAAAGPESPMAESPASEHPVPASPIAENPVAADPAPESVASESVASVFENPAQTDALPAPADTPAPADEAKTAATDATTPTAGDVTPVAAAEAAPTAPEPASASNLPSTGAVNASRTIATLGGPAVDIAATVRAKPASAKTEKPDKSALKKQKRLQTQRANARRRALARAAQQASQQQPPLDLFGQPMTHSVSR